MKLKTFLILVALVVLVGGLTYYSAQKKRPSSTPSATGGKVLPNLALGGDVAPKITAKNGVLHQDGSPCFLVGVWGGDGHDMGISVNNPYCNGAVELVPGRQGNGGKVSFHKSDKPINRWCDLLGIYPSVWTEQKYKTLAMWIKGDGSTQEVKFKVEEFTGMKTVSASVIGAFSLQDTNWFQVVIPLEDKYTALAEANICYFLLGATDREVHFIVDDVTVTGKDGEVILLDFDRPSSLWWSKWGERRRVKDDPVYKAIWNDPLYREVRGDNFKIIGMNSYHLAGMSETYVKDWIPPADNTASSMYGDAALCEKLKGMPMVPGFTFDWGAITDGGSKAEEFIRQLGLPPSVLQRTTKGHPIGSYMGICPEDPLGEKLYKTYWQRAARYLLAHGANIYAYELINENNGYYVCGCERNQLMFMERMKAKYKGDIAILNRTWGTNYRDFEAVKAQLPGVGCGPGPMPGEKIKGLSVEWEKFLGDRYVEVMRQGGEWIHEVEDELKKPHALMGQMSEPKMDMMGFGGVDMYKLAQGLDMIQIEGGLSFGGESFTGVLNPLTAVLASKGKYGYQMGLDLADAASSKKPIINTEHYWGRFRGEKREPVSRTDIITSLWEEFIRGVSAVHTYAWLPDYAGKEEALSKRDDRRMLSPHVFPRDSLNGYKDVQEEIGRVADVVMERPRAGRNAECAVLFSRPTARYLVGVPFWASSDWKSKHNFYRSHDAFYTYLLEYHYPMRYLYEEQLGEGEEGKYRVVFVPHSDNIYPETLARLTEYVRKGGVLVCFGDAFRFDEYGNEKEGNSGLLLGLERKKADAFVQTVEVKGFGNVKVISKREIIPKTAGVLVAFPEISAPFITVNSRGKGKVYYINLDMYNDKISGAGLEAVMNYVAGLLDFKAPLEVVGMDGKRLGEIEAYVIGRGRKQVVYLVNWTAYRDQAGKIMLRTVEENGKYYVADIGEDCLYTRAGQNVFLGSDLQAGINLVLPSQQRVVLLVSTEKYSTANKPKELLDDEQARDAERAISAELAQMEAKQGKIRKLVIGVRGILGIHGGAHYVPIKRCLETAAGNDVKIELIYSTQFLLEHRYGLKEGEDSVLTYQLSFRDELTDTEIEAILVKMLNALLDKYGDKLKIIKGWKEADILKIRENMLKAREYKAVGDCLSLDLRKQVNMGFKDEKANDQKGGLFDEGRNLKGLPAGSNTFAGIVFDVIDPEKNNGVACIVLRGKAKPFFPEKVEGILVGRKAKNIYILHGACYCAGDSHEVVYRLKFNYADNTDAYADIKAGSEIADWFSKPEDMLTNLTNACPGWMGKAIEKTVDAGEEKEWNICLYCARIANPKPEKEIRTMDIISANNAAVPAIFGITVEE